MRVRVRLLAIQNDIYVLFDTEAEGVARGDVGKLMRCMRLAPDEAEVDALVAEFVKGPTAKLADCEAIIAKFGQTAKHMITDDAIKQALLIFDQKGDRTIDYKEFVSTMSQTAFGEPFSDPEIQKILQVLQNPEGQDVSIDRAVDTFYAPRKG